MADSAFNESELHALGYRGTAVVPLLIDMQAKSDEPDPELQASLARRKAARAARPPLRRQDLAPQGAARSREDARRPPTDRRPLRPSRTCGLAAAGRPDEPVSAP